MWPKGELKFSDGAWIWDGGPVAMVNQRCLYGILLPDQDLSPGTVLQCGDYRIRILKDDWPDFRLFVVRDVWYAPLIVLHNKLERSLRITKAYFLRLAVIWGLADYPGEGMVYSWHCLCPVRWAQRLHMATQRLYRRCLSNYAIRYRLFWIEAQLRDLSARPFGYRFLSVAKGDYKVMTYLNGSDESERWVSEALVPQKAGTWGKGWVYRYRLNENGKPYQKNGDAAMECIFGQVMWRPVE